MGEGGAHKGTGFIKFETLESAEEAVSTSEAFWNEKVAALGKSQAKNLAEALDLNGRKIVIMRALSKQGLFDHIREKSQKEDKRNLAMLAEGLLNKQDFIEKEHIPEPDMQTRVRLYRSKNAAVKKNPNLFISSTRLCIRNLPKKFEEKDVWTLVSHFVEMWKESLPFEERQNKNLKTKKLIHQIKLNLDKTKLRDGKP